MLERSNTKQFEKVNTSLLRKHFKYTPIDKVLSALLEHSRLKPRVEEVLVLNSYGRILASDIVSSKDIPFMDTSHMDGYAISSADIINAKSKPVSFRVVGEIKIGSIMKREIRSGEAVRVSTGAFLPKGTDTILPVENVIKEGNTITVYEAKPGQFVYQKGSQIKAGETVLARGCVVRAQDVGILLSMGIEKIRVFSKPKVSIIATGSELVDIRSRKEGMVIDSHTPIFYDIIRECGCKPVKLGIVPDDVKRITLKLQKALRESDVILTIGGTSLGAYDLVGSAVKRLRPTYFVRGIKMDRGRVAGAAVAKGKPIIMMPGPIQGAMNAYVLLAYPILNYLTGREKFKIQLPARLTKDWVAREEYPDFTKVLYVRLIVSNAEIEAEPIIGPTESMKVLINSNGYVVVPENIKKLNKGEIVYVNLLPGFSHLDQKQVN